MKRILTLVLVLSILFSLTACFSSGKTHHSSTKSEDAVTTTKTTMTSNEETEITDKPVTSESDKHTTESVTQSKEAPATEELPSSEEPTTQTQNTNEVQENPSDLYEITFDIEFYENLMFSRYDVDLMIDGITQKTLAHGVDDVLTVGLKEGTHTLTFSKNGSSSIKGETTFIVENSETLRYKIACYNDKVTVTIKDGGGSSTPEASTARSETPPATDAPEEVKYGINDTITMDNLEFTVTKVTDKKVINSYWDDGKTDNNFVIITIKIKNIGTRQKYIDASDFSFMVGESVYETHNAALYLDDGLWLGDELGAGLSKTYRLVFEIPEEHKKKDRLVIKTSWFGDEAVIYMKKFNN